MWDWEKIWRFGVLALAVVALAAFALAPIPKVEMVVELPAPGARPGIGEVAAVAAIVVGGVLALLAPPALLILLTWRVLRKGRFLG